MFLFGSHGQSFMQTVDGFALSTAHDHRKLRGDPGYQSRDIKGGSSWLLSA
jgi:hypothetical protein